MYSHCKEVACARGKWEPGKDSENLEGGRCCSQGLGSLQGEHIWSRQGIQFGLESGCLFTFQVESLSWIYKLEFETSLGGGVGVVSMLYIDIKPRGGMTSPRGRRDREKKRSPELSKCYASGRKGRTSKGLRRSGQEDRRKTERLVLGVREV